MCSVQCIDRTPSQPSFQLTQRWNPPQDGSALRVTSSALNRGTGEVAAEETANSFLLLPNSASQFRTTTVCSLCDACACACVSGPCLLLHRRCRRDSGFCTLCERLSKNGEHDELRAAGSCPACFLIFSFFFEQNPSGSECALICSTLARSKLRNRDCDLDFRLRSGRSQTGRSSIWPTLSLSTFQFGCMVLNEAHLPSDKEGRERDTGEIGGGVVGGRISGVGSGWTNRTSYERSASSAAQTDNRA